MFLLSFTEGKQHWHGCYMTDIIFSCGLLLNLFLDFFSGKHFGGKSFWEMAVLLRRHQQGLEVIVN